MARRLTADFGVVSLPVGSAAVLDGLFRVLPGAGFTRRRTTLVFNGAIGQSSFASTQNTDLGGGLVDPPQYDESTGASLLATLVQTDLAVFPPSLVDPAPVGEPIDFAFTFAVPTDRKPRPWCRCFD